jgi:hypothetical protein
LKIGMPPSAPKTSTAPINKKIRMTAINTGTGSVIPPRRAGAAAVPVGDAEGAAGAGDVVPGVAVRV